MDGLNEFWEVHGCNLHDLIVLNSCGAAGNVAYWADKHGCKYPSVSYEKGGGELNEQLYGGGTSNGPCFLIYPDRKFVGALPKHFYNPNNDPTYEMFMAEANIPENNCDPTDSKKESGQSLVGKTNSLVTIKSLSEKSILMTINQEGKYSLAIYTVDGKQIISFPSEQYKKGTIEKSWDTGNTSSGVYMIHIHHSRGHLVQRVFLK